MQRFDGREASSDPMMDELRQIRDDIGSYAWSLPPEKMCEWFHTQAEETASEIGCQLEPHPTLPGKFRFVLHSAGQVPKGKSFSS